MTARVQDHRESLTAPLSWWLGTAVFGLTWGWILLVVTTWTIAGAAAIVTTGLTGLVLARYGSVRIEASSDELRVGDAVLSAPFIGDAEALGPDAWRQALGPQADTRAFLVTRPYIATGVRVGVNDPADPTPSWLVSTRHPDALVRALKGTSSTPTERTDRGQ